MEAISVIPVIDLGQRSPIRAPCASRLVSTHPPPPLLGVYPVVASSGSTVVPAVPVVSEVPVVAPVATLSLYVGVWAGYEGLEVDYPFSPVRRDPTETVVPTLGT